MSAQEKNGTYTVLVVDDEPDVVAYLEMVLQDAGYGTVSARNGKEGLSQARQHKPDLICLDITMPEESGVRLFRNLRDEAELAEVPVLVVTAVTGLGGDPEPFQKFLETRKGIRAPEGFFPKPIDREAFLAKIGEFLPPGS